MAATSGRTYCTSLFKAYFVSFDYERQRHKKLVTAIEFRFKESQTKLGSYSDTVTKLRMIMYSQARYLGPNLHNFLKTCFSYKVFFCNFVGKQMPLLVSSRAVKKMVDSDSLTLLYFD